ncbi:hypothetical protein GZL_07492 [Streptomyces sp. 769]|nr:hypothetical protein GZL_07492 [Streptomyces sp. 769]
MADPAVLRPVLPLLAPRRRGSAVATAVAVATASRSSGCRDLRGSMARVRESWTRTEEKAQATLARRTLPIYR